MYAEGLSATRQIVSGVPFFNGQIQVGALGSGVLIVDIVPVLLGLPSFYTGTGFTLSYVAQGEYRQRLAHRGQSESLVGEELDIADPGPRLRAAMGLSPCFAEIPPVPGDWAAALLPPATAASETSG